MINLDTEQAIKIEDMGSNEAMDSTLCFAARATRTTAHVYARAARQHGDHFDFMDGGSWPNESAEAQTQCGQQEVALLTRAGEVASYISQRPMLAEGVCSMEENDWLEVARAARRVMLHQKRTHQRQMVTPTVSSNAPAAISPLSMPAPVAQFRLDDTPVTNGRHDHQNDHPTQIHPEQQFQCLNTCANTATAGR